MSCSVIAFPIALYKLIDAIVASEVTAELINEVKDGVDNSNNSEFENNDYVNIQEVKIISNKHFIEKTFETVFMDKDILLKTLEEHGAVSIKPGESWENNRITAQIDSYTLIFEKEKEDLPYNVTIKCLNTDNACEKIEDLNNEYTLNVQEETYMSIIEKLKDNNMELEEEEVLDDNTIVLTINLD